jgi:hypothetical protein
MIRDGEKAIVTQTHTVSRGVRTTTNVIRFIYINK